jgi:hypothetical protein
VFAEDFAGVLVDDGDGVGVDEDGHGLTFVGCADAEVVHAAGAVEADFAEAVDVVIADSHRAGPGRRAAQCPRRPTPALDDHRQFRLDDPARRPPAPSEAASSHDLSSRSRVRWLLVRVGMNGAECLLRFHSSEDHDVDRDHPEGGARGRKR